MANSFQVTIDSAGPRALGAFWCEVLGYIEQPPPPGLRHLGGGAGLDGRRPL